VAEQTRGHAQEHLREAPWRILFTVSDYLSKTVNFKDFRKIFGKT
jgi:hypothetical protein